MARDLWLEREDYGVVGVQPQEAFTVLAKRLAVALRPYGFRRRGQTFYRRTDGNWGLINLQKSTSSTRHLVRFTINVGIFSERIGSPYRAPSGGPPSIWICHYHERIGFLLPVRQDHWWSIGPTTHVDALGDEIERHVIQVAVPEIDRYISDEALRDLWLSGRSPGETDVVRLRNLAVLLNRIGPKEHLEPTLEALRRYGVLANPGN